MKHVKVWNRNWPRYLHKKLLVLYRFARKSWTYVNCNFLNGLPRVFLHFRILYQCLNNILSEQDDLQCPLNLSMTSGWKTGSIKIWWRLYNNLLSNSRLSGFPVVTWLASLSLFMRLTWCLQYLLSLTNFTTFPISHSSRIVVVLTVSLNVLPVIVLNVFNSVDLIISLIFFLSLH